MDPAVPPPNPAAAGYPAAFELDRAEKIANWRPLVHWLLVIPHALVLYVLGIVAGVVAFIAWFAILFTGKWPVGLQEFVLGVLRWNTRVLAYYHLLVDEYPPFSME